MRLILPAFLALALTGLVHAQPVSLFDGKTLDGWDYDPKMWRVENGMITGGSTTEKITHNDFIATKKSYQNFELKLKIKVSGDPATGMLNSGIQIRSVRVPGGAHMSGYQIDCGAGWFGKIYDEFRRNKVIAEPVDPAALEKVVDVYGWNQYRIRAEGPRIQTWINGVLAIDYTEPDKNIAQDGQIGPQVHSGGVCLVQLKDITIEELPPTQGLPTWESLGGPEAARKLVAPPPKPSPNPKSAIRNPQSKAGRDVSYNAVQGTPKTAEEQQKLFKLPEGYEIELVVKESEGLGKFVSVYFDQRGRMWTQTAFEYPVDANENPAAAEALYQGRGKDKVVHYPRESLNAPLPPGGLTNSTTFADGLAIPLGILPWGNGDTCYIQHGHDLKLFKDTNGDGKADTHEVILTGFGVQDSHLFPHQFTRAPGGWIWMAQGLFNNSKVTKPGVNDNPIDFPKCSMARMRPDGSNFEVTSTGPNNIWGLVITGEGEAFIQEANDYGYPVMPFHEYAYYPGGMEPLRKSYQPEFPPQADFRMGGTGLSGLALGEGDFRQLTPTLKDDDLCMFVANPITSKIQTLAMHRDGPYWKLEQAPDLLTCADPFFRPVGLTNGPDGCIYIVDWYNKIISHNEVPRTHPDRDKTRGRIWRVKPKFTASQNVSNRQQLSTANQLRSAEFIPQHSATPQPPAKAPRTTPIPDFTQLPTEELIALLGTEPTAKAHLAWQTLADRPFSTNSTTTATQSPASVIQYHWAQQQKGVQAFSVEIYKNLPFTSPHKNLRLALTSLLGNPDLHSFDAHGLDCIQSTQALAKYTGDSDPEVRSSAIRSIGSLLDADFREVDAPREELTTSIEALLSFIKPSLPGPTTQSSRANKQIPVREAYDREFERFLVRMFLERHPDKVAAFLDSEAAAKLPLEARLLSSLALEPKTSASRIARLLPQLDRPPNEEELLRLAQFSNETGVGEAFMALLNNNHLRAPVVEKLLAHRTRIDPKNVADCLTPIAERLLKSGDSTTRILALKLALGFALPVDVYDPIVDRDERLADGKPVPPKDNEELVLSLNVLRDRRTDDAQLFYNLAKSDPDPIVRQAALEALMATSRITPSGTDRLLRIYPELNPIQRKAVLTSLSGEPDGGAQALLKAILQKTISQADLNPAILERLATVLHDDPAALAQLQQHLGGVFHEVLAFDGSDEAWCDSNITLDGPFTLETWVRLTGKIHNDDSILGSPGKLDMNFFQGKFRVWTGDLKDVAVSQKPITPDLWTHIAVTRDNKGNFTLYQNGELDATGTKASNQKFENCRIAWSGPKTGTEGAFTEYRLWNHARTAVEIRANFDRMGIVSEVGVKALADHSKGAIATQPITYPTPSLKLNKGARIAKTIDSPPLLTEDQAKALDTKFEKYTTLAAKGHPEAGKPFVALCMACHQIGSTGGQIGPNLSSAGAMGLEAVLRNILTPNAAMEPGYRTFRVEMTNGDLIDAFFVSEDKDAIIVRQPGLPDRRLTKADIRSTKFIRRSLMPEGLLDALPDQAAADLLAYLMTLK